MNINALKPLAWLIAAALVGGLASDVLADPGKGGMKRNSRPVPLAGTDDWQLSPPSGAIYCASDGTPVTNPFDPGCDPDDRVEVDDVLAYSNLHMSDPRFDGPTTFTFSASFDAETFTGPAWGTWATEAACGGTWEGTFQGDRDLVFGQPGIGPFPVWISTMEIRGVGSGGCIDGLRIRGTELITTISPVPVAYETFEYFEVIPGFCSTFGCLPEGVFNGEVYGPARRDGPGMGKDD